MKIPLKEGPELDPKKLWDDVEKAAARAPQWASLHPPFPVKPDYARKKAQETVTGDKKS